MSSIWKKRKEEKLYSNTILEVYMNYGFNTTLTLKLYFCTTLALGFSLFIDWLLCLKLILFFLKKTNSTAIAKLGWHIMYIKNLEGRDVV